MIVTKEELIQSITKLIGETPDDEALSVLENVTDTISDYEEKNKTDWKEEKAKLEQKIKDTDSEWRKKYTARFMQGTEHHDNDEVDDDLEKEKNQRDAENITIDDLFTTKGE